ncbi:MAG: hypothetical protein JF593_09185 [Novosphingobium sp.]|nr:hypothetical protein [Novosphingobium sp.]
MVPYAVPFADELRLRAGAVPEALDGVAVARGCQHLVGDSFLLRTHTGFGFYYRKGEGILVERPHGGDTSEESLWLNGSVYAAVASIAGFKPIHASAVAWNGRVHAFTGPGGAGKSTLIAGLGAQGLPMFCDDTLVLDLSDPERITCLPGHKRLKLLPDALALTGAVAEEKVAPDNDKFYARPPAGDIAVRLPLSELVFLEDGPESAMRPLPPGERFARLEADHHTDVLFAQAQKLDRAGLFSLHARLASQVPMARFVRPRDPARFAAGVAIAANHVRSARSVR